MTDTITQEYHLVRGEKVITKLLTISNIKPGDKWNTYLGAPQKPGFLQKISRTIWYISEDKFSNLADLENTMENAFDILQDIKTISETATTEERARYYQVSQRIMQSVLRARDGIGNLRVVYHDNEAVIFKIETVIAKLHGNYSLFMI